MAWDRFAIKEPSWSDPSRILCVLLLLAFVLILSAFYFILPFEADGAVGKTSLEFLQGGVLNIHTLRKSVATQCGKSYQQIVDKKMPPIGRLVWGLHSFTVSNSNTS